MIAIKNWFLEKNMMKGFYGKELIVKKETEKAVLITVKGFSSDCWIPKSCLCNEWEKQTSPFDYHDYLENLYHEAYKKGIIENRTIKSGRNTYAGDAFIHQCTNKELQKALDSYNIEHMTYTEFRNR